MIALLEARASGLWSRKHIANNVLAGFGVGVVALPLAMAFAMPVYFAGSQARSRQFDLDPGTRS
jgi:MFS superfamily sulfate permease-like transporter